MADSSKKMQPLVEFRVCVIERHSLLRIYRAVANYRQTKALALGNCFLPQK